MSDEIEKTADLASRDYVREKARAAGGFAQKNWHRFKGRFNRMGAVGQSATIGAIAGGVSGAVKGFSKNDPKIDWTTGEIRQPTMLTRAGRAIKGGAMGAGTGAAMSAGTSYLVRKLTHV
jgi:hypothetical protein